MDGMDIIVQFAKLWGIEVEKSKGKKRYDKLEAYTSIELLVLLCSWKKEYLTKGIEDTYDFFQEKIKTI